MYNSFLKFRAEFLGVAMLLVLLFHELGRFSLIPSCQPFRTFIERGFIGVDLFIFFSAIGLCYSWEKNSISHFYKNRFVRILPIFLCMALGVTLAQQLVNNADYGVWDVMCNFTTLSYYRLGGTRVDWYLSSLFLLYLVFPVLYKKLNKSIFLFVFFVCLFVSVVSPWIINKNVPWEYDCFICRIPIFCLGIFLFLNKKNADRYFKTAVLFFSIIGLLLVLLQSRGFRIQKFFETAMFAPLYIVFCSFLFKLDIKVINKILTFIGMHSLEIYAANVMANSVRLFFPEWNIFFDILFLFIGAIILYWVNRVSKSLIEKCYERFNF